MDSFFNTAILAVFIPTFFLVAITPGMCMTLSMTLGMTVGVRRTLWMMLGELLGVGLVATLSMVGVAAALLKYPVLFSAFKILGGSYLVYLGVQMWRSRGRLAVQEHEQSAGSATRLALATQGFVTAVANPKGWAFMVVLLPPFLSHSLPLIPQVLFLTILVLILEFSGLLIYAMGGQSLAHLLGENRNVQIMNRIAGTLMIGVGCWLWFS